MPGLSQIGFGGGIAEGLAAGIANKRERETRDKQAQIQNIWKSIGFLIDSGQVQDVAALQPHFDMLANLGAFGDQKKGGKKGELGPQDHVTNILGRIVGAQKPLQAGPMATQPTQNVGPDDAGNVQPESLPSRTIGSAAVPAVEPKARPTLMGIPILSPEEATQAKVARQTGAELTELQARIQFAREKVLPALKAVDPSATLDDALMAAKVPIQRLGTPSFSQIRGTIDGKEVPAIIDHRTGEFLDPATHQPLQNFVPQTTTGSVSLGADREAVAREMFGKRAADLTPDQMAQVNAKAEAQAASKAGAVTTARAGAEAKAPLSTQQRFQALTKLQEDWRKIEAPKKETERQYELMQTGLKRFKSGDKIGGSEAILTTFQKILDPSSVVRESEYARTPEGLGFLQRMSGWYERFKEGGAGVPVEQLEAIVQTAKDFVDGMKTYNDLEREQIEQSAKEASLDPARIFGASVVTKRGGTPAKAGTSVPLPDGFEMRDGKIYIKQ